MGLAITNLVCTNNLSDPSLDGTAGVGSGLVVGVMGACLCLASVPRALGFEWRPRLPALGSQQ